MSILPLRDLTESLNMVMRSSQSRFQDQRRTYVHVSKSYCTNAPTVLCTYRNMVNVIEI